MKNKQIRDLDSEAEVGTSSSQNLLFSRLKKRLRKYAWPLHARYPNIIPNPYGDDRLYFSNRDVEANSKTSLEAGINLHLGCFMVSEIFGPNEIEHLYKRLENLGWDEGRYSIKGDTNIDWLREQRLYGGEGRIPLGFINRAGTVKTSIGREYTAKFPKEFSSLIVNISQLTPSITCLTVGFVLTDEASLEYADAIMKPAKTTRIPKKRRRAYSIMGVEHVKEERVNNIRDKYRNLSIGWISKNFPGFFAENCKPSQFPSVEFLSLNGFTPFDNDAQKSRGWGHWSRFVNIDQSFDSWTSTSSPALRFSLVSGHRDDTANHMTAALRWDMLSDQDKAMYGDDTLGVRSYIASEHLDGIIAKFALAGFLGELLRNLKETRQSLSSSPKSVTPTTQVDTISDFFRSSIGVPAIAREVLALSQNDASFRWNATGFTQKSHIEGEEPRDIKEALKSTLGRLSQQLLEQDTDTREFLNQLSSALGTKESIAVQKRMENIARTTLVVAIASTVVAIFGALGD